MLDHLFISKATVMLNGQAIQRPTDLQPDGVGILGMHLYHGDARNRRKFPILLQKLNIVLPSACL